MTFEPFDQELTKRAQREDCPIPEGFDARVTQRLEQLPEQPGRKNWGIRRLVVLLAAALLLTACAAGAGIVLQQQMRTHYFRTEAEAQAAIQSAHGEDAFPPEYDVYDYEMPDYETPPKIEDVALLLSISTEVLAHEMGGPEDGWTEMFIRTSGKLNPQKETYYKGDTMQAYADFWPVETPDFTWLEANYVPLSGHQRYIRSEGVEGKRLTLDDWKSDPEGAEAREFLLRSLEFFGDFQDEDGNGFSLSWHFGSPDTGLTSDAYMVTGSMDQLEEYTTTDGIPVQIEWFTSAGGQARFFVDCLYGLEGSDAAYVQFSMEGADIQPEEIHQILDRMNLSALSTYEYSPQ